MNEKISYLFFQHEKDSLPLFLSENIAEYLPALIFIYDVESRKIQYGNESFRNYTGQFAGSTKMPDDFLSACVHGKDLEAFEKLLQTPRNERDREAPCVTRLADRHGQYRSHQIQATWLQLNEEGRAKLILLIAHDITDALKSKEEIETTRELLDETEELLQFGSWAWEISTRTVTWTSGLYSLLEYSREEVAGRIGFDFYLSHVVDEYIPAFQELIQNALKEKTDFSYEYEIKTRSGTLKNISTRGKLVKGEDGEVIKILCINRDITALRSFEKEQERNIRELNRSNRDLEEFAYIASHDLQEPLRKISMFTERLKAKYDKSLDKEGELFIERILAAASNMRTLIDNLLDFSRANRRSHTFDQVNIKNILTGVVSELELKIEETKASIKMSGNFPTIEAVTSEMTQLFGNILSNAIKFRKQQGVAEINVHANKLSKSEKQVLGLPPSNTFHKIEVSDNGIGFELEYADKIFQIFQRLNGKSEYPGSGIGLAICKKITEKHNGLIFAQSQPDEGATFTVILPEKQF